MVGRAYASPLGPRVAIPPGGAGLACLDVARDGLECDALADVGVGLTSDSLLPCDLSVGREAHSRVRDALAPSLAGAVGRCVDKVHGTARGG